MNAIHNRFLSSQVDEGAALDSRSDLVDICPVAGDPPDRYVIQYRCLGLTRTADLRVVEGASWTVGIWFPSNYLRTADPYRTLTWLAGDLWHPNVLPARHLVCIGLLAPGTGLVELVHRIFDLITYHRWAAHDALCHDAAQWARNERHRFPIDRRPLVWRRPTGVSPDPSVPQPSGAGP